MPCYCLCRFSRRKIITTSTRDALVAAAYAIFSPLLPLERQRHDACRAQRDMLRASLIYARQMLIIYIDVALPRCCRAMQRADAMLRACAMLQRRQDMVRLRVYDASCMPRAARYTLRSKDTHVAFRHTAKRCFTDTCFRRSPALRYFILRYAYVITVLSMPPLCHHAPRRHTVTSRHFRLLRYDASIHVYVILPLYATYGFDARQDASPR